MLVGDIIARMCHDGCGGRLAKPELVTDIRRPASVAHRATCRLTALAAQEIAEAFRRRLAGRPGSGTRKCEQPRITPYANQRRYIDPDQCPQASIQYAARYLRTCLHRFMTGDQMPAFAFPQLSGRLNLFRSTRAPRPHLGPRREDIVGLSGAICRALPPDLAKQFKSLDTANGIRVTPRTGEAFWFMPNTAVRAIVAHIVEKTSR